MNPKITLILSLSAASVLTLASCAQNEPVHTAPSHSPYQSKGMYDSNRRADTNRPSDINMTAQIRRDVLATRNMSFNAQNVKIITTNGFVTLSGPVDSLSEKQSIGQIAQRVAGNNQVDNRLTVRRTNAQN